MAFSNANIHFSFSSASFAIKTHSPLGIFLRFCLPSLFFWSYLRLPWNLKGLPAKIVRTAEMGFLRAGCKNSWEWQFPICTTEPQPERQRISQQQKIETLWCRDYFHIAIRYSNMANHCSKHERIRSSTPWMAKKHWAFRGKKVKNKEGKWLTGEETVNIIRIWHLRWLQHSQRMEIKPAAKTGNGKVPANKQVEKRMSTKMM